jgi:DNA recombination protein RmuC
MNTELLLTALFAGAALAALGGGFLVWRQADAERRRAEALAERLEVAVQENGRLQERVRGLEAERATLGDYLKAQAAQSAQAVAEQLVQRASETFQAQDRHARAALEAQLKPVAETLAKFEAKVGEIDKARADDSGGLKAQLAALMHASVATQAEARRLSGALRRGAGVQGRWGEQALRNALEMAGLTHHFDFVEQTSLDTEEGRRRPDVTVRLPGGGVFVIDAKANFTAFMEAQEAEDEEIREAALLRHAAAVRAHVSGLSAKAYWDQFARQGSPDFVAMFVPGDGLLAAALERAPDLMSEAMGKRVVIVTPTTLFALCKAVAYGWRVEEQARNADQVARLGRELYKRLSVMGGHVTGVGKALDQAVRRYNDFVGSLETQVLTGARKFEDLAVDHEGKTLPPLDPVETAVRQPAKLLADAEPPTP